MSAPTCGELSCDECNDRYAALTAERDQLRAVFPKVCAALANGAFCRPTVSVGFIESIPNEVQLVVAELRARAERAEADLAALEQSFDDNCRGVVKIADDLAAERARLDWVFHNCKVTSDDFTVHDREDLGVAMKEDVK